MGWNPKKQLLRAKHRVFALRNSYLPALLPQEHLARRQEMRISDESQTHYTKRTPLRTLSAVRLFRHTARLAPMLVESIGQCLPLRDNILHQRIPREQELQSGACTGMDQDWYCVPQSKTWLSFVRAAPKRQERHESLDKFLLGYTLRDTKQILTRS
jgi:hypothetical protein